MFDVMKGSETQSRNLSIDLIKIVVMIGVISLFLRKYSQYRFSVQ